ncbi:hypothetical protein [Niabella drilacis]|uniref:Uncharacterized protein n=1 Tax=Niabella drilacis (strain DSM 25811 / CCM 8410 / CCUG 62505 / LMG 26954 / E90) TaxID=1285928 RepID=A0A1G6SAW9_NIADE|nr:hypothetical protein [Niabella drilacis]SDD13873.1 hypothetical protein SAMN04487894_106157 [Niabella drilacis]
MIINQDITENLFPEAKPAAPFFVRRATVWKMTGIAVALTVLLYFLTTATMDEQITDLYDRAAGAGQMKKDLLLFLMLGVPVLGFALSLPVSFLPYKKARYPKKYVPFAVMAILGIQFFLMAIRLINLLILTNKK